ncbi:hypothetical protein ACIGCZ_00740 [Streptomyces nigra]|uniref:hypothetical protein n=1 Tax=Streptomyces nigra TaxID=1827580 RepID=UPI0037CEAD06
MNARTALPATLFALAALTAGCTTDSSSDEAAPTTSSAPSPDSASATPEPSPSLPKALAIGDTWKFEGTDESGGPVNGTVTVLGYKQDVKAAVTADEEFNTKGYVWAALELKTCSVEGSFWATTSPWTLSYEDGARIEPSSTTYDSFPRPEFPFETKLTTGKCVRGHVVYPVPGDQRPATVVYAPEGMDPKEWAMPKA